MILQVQNGCFGYPGQPAILENIDLTLEEGHILAILGPKRHRQDHFAQMYDRSAAVAQRQDPAL